MLKPVVFILKAHINYLFSTYDSKKEYKNPSTLKMNLLTFLSLRHLPSQKSRLNHVEYLFNYFNIYG